MVHNTPLPLALGRVVSEPSASDVNLLVYNYLKQNGFGHLATQFKQETGGLKKEDNPFYGLKLQVCPPPPRPLCHRRAFVSR